MLHSHSHHHHLLFSSLPLRLSLTTTHHNSSLPSLHFLHRPIITTTTTTTTVSAIPPTAAWLAKLTTQDFAHFELPSSHLFTDDPSTIQVACSVLLTGAITVFFFRSVQRRAKRAKELKFRSSGVNKSLDNLKAISSSSIKAKSPPSPDQALLGAIIAGVIAVVLYRFTTSIEATLGRQTLSDNFSVSIISFVSSNNHLIFFHRTIINGLCYLATFVYGINSVGLFLYSGQLAMDTMGGGSSGKETESKITQQPGLSNASEDQSSNNSL
uniref:Transmembrane protein n=1 Tax=Glycine max TaxID=3847 RepID=I1KDQ2_SOYBN